MQMYIFAGRAASLTCNSLPKNICQMCLQMTYIFNTHLKNWHKKKHITSERLSNLCSDTAAPNNFLNQRPRSPENHFSLWLFLIQLYNLLSFSLYRQCSDSTTYYELKFNSLQVKFLYFWDPTSFRQCNKETWEKSGYKTWKHLVYLWFRRLLGGREKDTITENSIMSWMEICTKNNFTCANTLLCFWISFSLTDAFLQHKGQDPQDRQSRHPRSVFACRTTQKLI